MRVCERKAECKPVSQWKNNARALCLSVCSVCFLACKESTFHHNMKETSRRLQTTELHVSNTRFMLHDYNLSWRSNMPDRKSSV